MTVEERVQHMLGTMTMQIAVLQTELEKRDLRIAELEKANAEKSSADPPAA